MSHDYSLEQKKKYKKRMWIALLAPIGVFVWLVSLWSAMNLIVAAIGLEPGTSAFVVFIDTELAPLLFAICILATPVAIVVAAYYAFSSWMS